MFIVTNCLVFRNKPEEIRKLSSGTFQICGIDVRIFVLLGILSGVFALGLNLGAFASKEWVKGEGFSGGLMRCKDCYEVKWMNWRCLEGFYCEVNGDSEECKNYEKLAKAEAVFMPVMIVGQFLLLLSFQQSGALLIFQNYGFFYMNYVRNI